MTTPNNPFSFEDFIKTIPHVQNFYFDLSTSYDTSDPPRPPTSTSTLFSYNPQETRPSSRASDETDYVLETSDASIPRLMDITFENTDMIERKTEKGCGFCRSIGVADWKSHWRTSCRTLATMAPCKICGAQGTENHTATYCPMKKPVYLELKSSFEIRSSLRLQEFTAEKNLKYARFIQILRQK